MSWLGRMILGRMRRLLPRAQSYEAHEKRLRQESPDAQPFWSCEMSCEMSDLQPCLFAWQLGLGDWQRGLRA